MSYTPKGKVAAFLKIVEVDLSREFTSLEIAKILDCGAQSAVAPMLGYAMKAALIFRRKVGRCMLYRGKPYSADEVRGTKEARKPRQPRNPLKMGAKGPAGWTPEPGDPRIPRVVQGWTPPKMVAPRAAA